MIWSKVYLFHYQAMMLAKNQNGGAQNTVVEMTQNLEPIWRIIMPKKRLMKPSLPKTLQKILLILGNPKPIRSIHTVSRLRLM